MLTSDRLRRALEEHEECAKFGQGYTVNKQTISGSLKRQFEDQIDCLSDQIKETWAFSQKR